MWRTVSPPMPPFQPLGKFSRPKIIEYFFGGRSLLDPYHFKKNGRPNFHRGERWKRGAKAGGVYNFEFPMKMKKRTEMVSWGCCFWWERRSNCWTSQIMNIGWHFLGLKQVGYLRWNVWKYHHTLNTERWQWYTIGYTLQIQIIHEITRAGLLDCQVVISSPLSRAIETSLLIFGESMPPARFFGECHFNKVGRIDKVGKNEVQGKSG